MPNQVAIQKAMREAAAATDAALDAHRAALAAIDRANDPQAHFKELQILNSMTGLILAARAAGLTPMPALPSQAVGNVGPAPATRNVSGGRFPNDPATTFTTGKK